MKSDVLPLEMEFALISAANSLKEHPLPITSPAEFLMREEFFF